MLPLISLGNFALPTAPLTMLFGIWLGLTTVEWASKKLGLPSAKVYNLASGGVFAGIISARISFVLSHLSAYQDNPLGIFWPLNSGYNMWVGLGVALGFILLYGQAKQLPLLKLCDALTAGILVWLFFISLGDFLAGPRLRQNHVSAMGN